MSDHTQEIDVDQVTRAAKEDYETKTGHELPDHVLENLDVLGAVGPSLEDVDRIVEYTERRHADRVSSRQAAAAVAIAAVLSGGVGYGAGVGLASTFGVAVVAVVSAAFGFALAALAT